MRRLLFTLVALSGLALLLVAQSEPQQLAQGSEEGDLDEQTRIILDVTRVNILFTVSDKKGRFVTDLAKDNFEVVERRKKQNILEFASESDLPLRLAILIDTSNSIRDRFKFQQEAAIEFINSVVRPEVDKAIVVSFDTGVELIADLTGDPEKLAEAIRELRPGGGTALYDAIFYACRDKLMQDKPRHKFRRALVILSDGEDNQSRYSRDQALEIAEVVLQRGRVLLIGFRQDEADGHVLDAVLGNELLRRPHERMSGGLAAGLTIVDLCCHVSRPPGRRFRFRPARSDPDPSS